MNQVVKDRYFYFSLYIQLQISFIAHVNYKNYIFAHVQVHQQQREFSMYIFGRKSVYK